MGCEIINIGETTALICGRKDHECDDNGPVIFGLKDGSEIEDTPENREKHQDEIISGSVSCSICGRLAIEDRYYL